MKRGMRGIKGDIEVERFLRLAGFTQKIKCKVDVGNCGVEGLIIENGGDAPLLAIQTERVVSFEEITGAAQVSEISIKTKVSRLTIEMPLASHRGEITGISKNFS